MPVRRHLRGILVSTALVTLACDAAAPAAAQPPRAAPAPAPAPGPAPEVRAPELASPPVLSIGERIRLRSQALGEERELVVYTPRLDPGVKYPVVYLLDGDRHFHHVTGLLDFLAVQNRMPPVILVGVVNTDRTRDFTPSRVEPFATSGGADKFLDFFERELVPAIDGRFPTAPYRILIGHSFGGLLALHALNTRAALFDAYISISPSTGWDHESPRRGTEALLRAQPGLDKSLYVSVGDEPGEQLDSNRAYARMLAARAPKSLRWHTEELLREDHGSLVHRSVYNGLEHVFDIWRPPAGADTLAALEEHWSRVGERYHVSTRIPEVALNLFGYRLMGEGHLDEAIVAFKRNVELYPESANVHDSLGEALEKKGDREAAATEYAAAVAAAERRDEQTLLPIFRANLERVRKPAAK